MFVEKTTALGAATRDKINSAPVGDLGIVPFVIFGSLRTRDLAEMQFMVWHIAQIDDRLRACLSRKRTRNAWHVYLLY
jgi:hypothetical protein